LISIKEEVEDPQIVQRIHNILIPREFTRLDEIADILFSATEEIKQETVQVEERESEGDKKTKEPRFTPVAFHDACISRIQAHLNLPLIKRTRAQYSTPDKSTIINCAVSKEHNPESKPNYWFAFHPHQREALQHAQNAFVAFGCGTSKRLLLIPFSDFDPLLEGMWTTQKDERLYWHVVIYRRGERYSLRRKKGEKSIDVTPYFLPTSQ
jgi:hypothetical protein